MATMKDIANEAGVSRSAVSFVLNNAPQAEAIRPEVREKILSAARTLKYRRNRVAEAMITGRTRTLGFVSPPPSAQYLANMLSGVLHVTEERNYSIKYMEAGGQKTAEKIFNEIMEHRLDGVVIQAYHDLENLHKLLTEHKIPFAVTGNSFPFKNGIRVISDDIAGGTLAVEHLYRNGHKKICYIGNTGRLTVKIPTASMRVQGYKNGCRKYGLSDSEDAIFDLTEFLGEKLNPEHIDKALESVIKEHQGLTGIFTFHTYLAANIIKSLRRMNYRVPEDISVIGYTVSEINIFCDPPITAIDQEQYKMGSTAAEELINFIDNDSSPLFENLYQKVMPIKLLEGGTVAKR